jgi:hypothetical protein
VQPLCICPQVLGFFVYNFVTNFILEPTYQTCFTNTLQKLKQDPRITVRLGNDIVGKWQYMSALQGRLSPLWHMQQDPRITCSSHHMQQDPRITCSSVKHSWHW